MRTTVNLIWAAAEILDRLSRTTGYSKTDIINQSIKLRGAVQDRIDRGGELYMIYPDGKTEVFVL